MSKRLISMCAALALFCGCATASSAQRDTGARAIADDAISFNDAYGQAVTGQILLNILRGRDRLPRHYLSMTGISNAPSLRRTESGGIGGIPLGGGGTPIGIGSLNAERETTTQPNYAVQPFSAETLTRTAFQPVEPYIFAHYWTSGWPRDLLLLLMVERIEKTDAEGEVHVYSNEANEIFDNCADSVRTGGCDFVRQVRDFLISTQESPRESGIDVEHGRPLCGLVEAIRPTTPIKPLAPAAGRDCAPVFAVGSTTIRLRLRSLDDIVYYVGELLRADSTNAAPGDALEAHVSVRAVGLRGGGAGVPLFRIVPAASVPHGVYAAAIDYAGVRYVAGPGISRSCPAATATGPCVDDAAHGDRSSSVLDLIAELMALNQSPDAIRAPNRVLAQ